MNRLHRALRLALPPILVVVAVLGGRAFLLSTRQPLPHSEARDETAVVEVVEVEPGVVAPPVFGHGNVQPAVALPLASEVPGRVTEVGKALRPGVRFSEGDELWRLDTRDQEIARKRLEAGIERHRASIERLEESQAGLERRVGILTETVAVQTREVERLQALHEQEAVAQVAVDRAQLGLNQARDGLTALENQLALLPIQTREIEAAIDDLSAQIEALELTEQRAVMSAPFDGWVQQGQVEVGQLLAPGVPVLQAQNLDVVEITVPFRLAELAWAALDGEPERSIIVRRADAGPASAMWPAKVARVGGVVDPGTQTQSVTFRVEQSESSAEPFSLGELLPGTFVSVQVPGLPIEGAVVVPRRALRDGDALWLLVDGRIEREAVTVVRHADDRVVVRGKLPERARVIVTAPAWAFPGSPARARGDSIPTESPRGDVVQPIDVVGGAAADGDAAPTDTGAADASAGGDTSVDATLDAGDRP